MTLNTLCLHAFHVLILIIVLHEFLILILKCPSSDEVRTTGSTDIRKECNDIAFTVPNCEFNQSTVEFVAQ